MSDNVINASGVPIATDELATLNGVGQTPPLPQAQRIKPIFGADGDGTDVDLTHGLPVHIVAGVAGGGPATVADGADVAQGAAADAAVAAGAAGTLSAKLRRLTTDLGALLAQLPATLGQKTRAGSLSVTLASDQPAISVTGGGGGTQFAEDTAHSSGDLGTLMLAIRNDAGTSLVSATGDYGGLQLDASGRLRIVQDAALPAGANAIGSVGVTSLPALVASSAAIGKLTANPGVTIGSVDVLTMAALIASSAIIGKVGIDTTTPGTTDRVSSVGTTTILVTPTLASGGAYAIGDFIGPSGGLGIGVNPAARATGGGGVLVGLVMIDGDNQGIPLDVYVFANSNWTSPSDNAAWSLSDSSAKYCVGRVAFNTFVSYGAAGMWGFGTFPEGPIYYQCNGQTLYLAPVTRGAPTYTATPSSTAGIQFRVALQPD